MISTYIGIGATVIALANSVISAFLTNFPPANANTKKNLIIASMLLSSVAAACVVATAAKESNDRAALVKKHDDERLQLGEFIEQGAILDSDFGNPDKSAPFQAADIWADKVETYLEKELGHGYVQRFRDGSGIFHGVLSSPDPKRVSYWAGIYERNVRLEQFSGEIPH